MPRTLPDMRMRTTLTLAALLAASALAVPAAAATTRWVTIRADRDAWKTVNVPRGVTLLLGQPGDAGPVVSITGGGAEAGFLLTPTRGAGDTFGQLDVASATGRARYSMGDERQPIAAGSYRLRVVAASPVVIRVPVTGMPAATWRATQPMKAERGTAAWDAPAGPVLLGGVDVTLTPSSVALFSVAYEATGMGGDATVCLTTRTGVCAPNEGAWSATVGHVRTGPAVRARGGFAAFADRTVGGRFTARWRVTSAGVALTPEAFALVIE